MPKRIVSTLTCLVFVLSALVAVPFASAANLRKGSPNIVLVLMDDMGWRDVGFMGNSFVETPHLDRLAKSGIIFSQAYASAPNCAPTRACLMSGQYTPRHGIYTVVDPRQMPGSPWQKLMGADSRSELASENVTIAEALEAGGYATAFFGMWNLGRGRTGPMTPGGQGFQHVVFPENMGFSKDAYFDSKGNYLSDRLADEVLAFIDKRKDQPFFVYLADHAVHAPYEPKPALLNKYTLRAARDNDGRNDPKYAATIEAVDFNVGRIVDRLSKLSLTDNTYIVFTSDNGGTARYTPPLHGGKGELYEGGIRVPLAITGPRLHQPGRVCNTPVASIDLYPTLLELAGVARPENKLLDGVSLAPALLRGEELARSRMYWHFPSYVGKATPASAMREGDYKLIEFFEDGGHIELYNLQTDPGEERNLAKTMSDKAATMHRTLQAWQKETAAMIPREPNPKFDPKADRPRGGAGGAPAASNNAPGGKKKKGK